jgi:hypothetical protein
VKYQFPNENVKKLAIKEKSRKLAGLYFLLRNFKTYFFFLAAFFLAAFFFGAAFFLAAFFFVAIFVEFNV